MGQSVCGALERVQILILANIEFVGIIKRMEQFGVNFCETCVKTLMLPSSCQL